MVRYERLDIKFVYFLINLELRISCIQFLSLLGIRLSGDWMLGPCCGSSTGDDMGLDGSHGSSASMNPPQHFLLWGDLEFSSLLHQQHQWQKCVPSQGIEETKLHPNQTSCNIPWRATRGAHCTNYANEILQLSVLLYPISLPFDLVAERSFFRRAEREVEKNQCCF